ncbi:MAG: ATP-binding cassette domain-containing protein [Nevskia sp.]|nr:ATP-binding cassette domain-containing protein [Nevskia sp.]
MDADTGLTVRTATDTAAEAVFAEGVVKQINTGGGDLLSILDGLSLRVLAGESVAIVGASGSGKTTLLSLLAGLDLPTAGEIRLDGRSLTELDEDGRARLRAGRVGFVFQSFQLLSGLTALENVMLPAELAGYADAGPRARTVLERVGLGQRLDHYPHQMSGGEQQRVAIARAFAAEPHILFADEPTGNLDLVTGSHIIDLLFELNRSRGTTLILVTHDTALARRCGRVLTLNQGRLHE